MSNFGWPSAPHWATMSCVTLSTSTPSAASDQFYFVWDISKSKATGSDHLLAYKRFYNLIFAIEDVQFGLAVSTTLGHHIVCSDVHIDTIRC